MPEVDEDRLVGELRALGRGAAAPPLDLDRLAAGVTRAVSVGREPRATRRRLVLVALALLATLVASPPVRAAVLDWLGFAGVRVESGDPDGAPSAPPDLSGGPEVEEAAARVSFTVLMLDALGTPTGVDVAPDSRMVSMTWNAEGTVLRLDQFDGTLDYAIAKQSPEVRFVAVGETDALWFEEPHEVVLLDQDGGRRTETARLAGHTLIWPDGDTTLRLEGDLALDDAVRIAESATPVE